MVYSVAMATGLPTHILGIPLGIFLFVLILFVIAVFFIWRYRRREKKRATHQIDTTDSIVIQIKNAANNVEFRKCKVYKGEIRDFTPQGSRVKFQTAMYVNREDDTRSAEKYFAVPGFGKLIWWPIGLEKRLDNGQLVPDPQQSQYMMWSFDENDPCPKWPNDPTRWNPGEAEQITSAMTHEAFNEYGMTAINKSMQGIVQNIEKFVALIQKIPLIFIFSCVQLLFLLFIAYLAFQTNGGVNRIISGK